VGRVRRFEVRFATNLALEFGGVLPEVMEESGGLSCGAESVVLRVRFPGKGSREHSDLPQVLVQGLPAGVWVIIGKTGGVGVSPKFHRFPLCLHPDPIRLPQRTVKFAGVRPVALYSNAQSRVVLYANYMRKTLDFMLSDARNTCDRLQLARARNTMLFPRGYDELPE